MSQKFKPTIKAPIVTTAVVLSPEQYIFLQNEKIKRGRGTNISSLVREAIENYYGPEARDTVAAQGAYDRTAVQRPDEDDRDDDRN